MTRRKSTLKRLADAETIRLRTEVARLETENHDLRNQVQLQMITVEELRPVLLALVVAIQQRATRHGYVELASIELQLQDSREVLVRNGLL